MRGLLPQIISPPALPPRRCGRRSRFFPLKMSATLGFGVLEVGVRTRSGLSVTFASSALL